MSRPERIDATPFLRWVDFRLAQLEVQAQIEGRSPTVLLYAQCGWSQQKTGACDRRLSRWREGVMAQRTLIEDALDSAGVDLAGFDDDGRWVELYPDLASNAERVQWGDEVYCWCCRAFVTSLAGRCPWCEYPIESYEIGSLPSRDREQAQLPVSLRVIYRPRRASGRRRIFDENLKLRRIALEHYVAGASLKDAARRALRAGASFSSVDSAYGSLRNLMAREGLRTRQDAACALADGTWDHVVERKVTSGRRAFGEDVVWEAAWLYFYEELSWSQVAQRLWRRTSCSNAHSCSAVLQDEWDRRGWPRRTWHSSGLLRGYAEPAQSQRCRQMLFDGSRCRRYAQAWILPAMSASSYQRCVADVGRLYCLGHDPLSPERRRILAKHASDRAYFDAVPSQPFGHWLRRQAKIYGSLAAVHRQMLGADGKPVITYDTLSRIATVWAQRPGASRAQRIRRSTVDRILEAWGRGVSFEDIYLPVRDDDEAAAA